MKFGKNVSFPVSVCSFFFVRFQSLFIIVDFGLDGGEPPPEVATTIVTHYFLKLSVSFAAKFLCLWGILPIPQTG